MPTQIIRAGSSIRVIVDSRSITDTNIVDGYLMIYFSDGTVDNAGYVGGGDPTPTPTPTPTPPVFSSVPMITGVASTGRAVSTLTFTDGVANAPITSRAYLLAGVAVTTSYVFQAGDAGKPLVYTNTAQNADGVTVSQSSPVLVVSQITISGTPPTTGQVGFPYTFAPVASNGSGGRTFNLTSGVLLGGLTFSTSTGAIGGTPNVSGTMTNIVVTVTDATGSASTVATTVTIAAAASLVSASPNAAWNGTASSGYSASAAPVNPTRTVGKPGLHPLVAPNQRFVSDLILGCEALANDGSGSLINGVDRVRLHVEGNVYDIQPSYQTIADANGVNRDYWGYWAKLNWAAFTTSGDIDIYWEAIPTYAPMQRRVMGPYRYTRGTGALHVMDVTVGTSGSGATYLTWREALLAIKAANPAQARITFISPGIYNSANVGGGASSLKCYVTHEATVPVTIGFPTYTSDAANLLRIGIDGLHFRGSNITFDKANLQDFYYEFTGRNHWFDGVNITNSQGRTALWRGGLQTTSSLVRGSPYYTECNWTFIKGPATTGASGVSLVRGGSITSCYGDVFSDTYMIKGPIRVTDHDASEFTVEKNAFTLKYNGAEATGTISLSGISDGNGRIVTLKAGGSSVATFTLNSTDAAYQANTNYTMQNVVDFINGQPGWNATLSTGGNARRATSLSKIGGKGAAFTDLDCKTATLQLVSMFDLHADGYQANSRTENVIMDGVIGDAISGQWIYPAGSGTAATLSDMFFINTACDSVVGSDASFNLNTNVFSQVNRPHSHVCIAHNSLSRQGFKILNSSLYTADSLCMNRRNVFREFLLAAPSNSVGGVIEGNRIFSGSTLPLGAVNFAVGGTRESLYVNAGTADFRPAGELLSDVRAPVVSHAANGGFRGATDALGALAIR